MQALVVGWVDRRRIAGQLKVFLRRSFGTIACRRLKDDSRGEDSAEVGDAEQEHQQHGQDQGELNHGLTASRKRCSSVELWAYDLVRHDVGTMSGDPAKPVGGAGPLESARAPPL